MAWKNGQKSDRFNLRETMEEYLLEAKKTLNTDEPDPYFSLQDFKDWATKKGVEFFPGEVCSALTLLVREGKVGITEDSEGVITFMITGR